MGQHVTKLTSLHSFHTKNISWKFHQNLVNQIQDIWIRLFWPHPLLPFLPFFSRNRFFPDMRFSQNVRGPLDLKKVHINSLDFCQKLENLIFGSCWTILICFVFAKKWLNGILRAVSKKNPKWVHFSALFSNDHSRSGILEFFWKIRIRHFWAFIPLPSCKVSSKSLANYEKSVSQTYERTDARTDRHEFKGPFRQGRSPRSKFQWPPI